MATILLENCRSEMVWGGGVGGERGQKSRKRQRAVEEVEEG